MSQEFGEGPCKVCGDVDYRFFDNDASICASCARGIPVEANRLRKELRESQAETKCIIVAVQSLLAELADYFEGELADDPANEMAGKFAGQLRLIIGMDTTK